MATALFTTYATTGIVVDCGHFDTRVLPICDGVPLYLQHQFSNVGGTIINDRLRCALVETALKNNPQYPDIQLLQTLSDDIVEDIKIRCCYCRYTLQNNDGQFHSKNDGSYPVNNSFNIVCSETVRWQVYEVLWGSEGESIVDAIIRSLEACTVDLRPRLIQNIVLCGGTAESRGFKTRLAIEIRERLLRHKTLNHIVDLVRFSKSNFSPFAMQWVGASLLSALDLSAIEGSVLPVYTSENFHRGDSLPDWIYTKS